LTEHIGYQRHLLILVYPNAHSKNKYSMHTKANSHNLVEQFWGFVFLFLLQRA